jgi:ketosteroid isomerase-like protein
MWRLSGFLLGSLLLVAAPPARAQVPGSARDSVASVLDDFHDAASHADYRRYFSHFAHEAVFIGTDATERWTVGEFRVYAKRRFDAGDGWTYVPRVRHVYMAPGGNTAWFDEILDNEHYGETRSTGVLIREDGAWKIAQYHLTIPIPNDLADRVVAMIREHAREAGKGGGR